jgi:hypothetical protein
MKRSRNGFAVKRKAKIYAVIHGHRPGVYENYADAFNAVSGAPGGTWKSYDTMVEAKEAVEIGRLQRVHTREEAERREERRLQAVVEMSEIVPEVHAEENKIDEHQEQLIEEKEEKEANVEQDEVQARTKAEDQGAKKEMTDGVPARAAPEDVRRVIAVRAKMI